MALWRILCYVLQHVGGGYKALPSATSGIALSGICTAIRYDLRCPNCSFLCSIQCFLFKDIRRNSAPWTKPEYRSRNPEYFIAYKETPFAPLLLSQDCFSHPDFGYQQCHGVVAAAGCLCPRCGAGRQPCLSRNCMAGTALPRRELPGEQMGLLRMDASRQDFSPFSANWPELEFNCVQRTYGSQGSIRLIAVCSLAAGQLQL